MSENLPVVRPSELDAFSLGDVFSKSGYFQDARQAAQAIVKVLAGRELGIPPVASMTGIRILDSKITLAAITIAGLIKKSGRYNYRLDKVTNEECTGTFFENGKEVGKSTFTIQDAMRAELINLPAWKKFPKNMLCWRMVVNGARFYCPDIFLGPIYSLEEMADMELPTTAHDLVQIELQTPQIKEPETLQPDSHDAKELETPQETTPTPPSIDTVAAHVELASESLLEEIDALVGQLNVSGKLKLDLPAFCQSLKRAYGVENPKALTLAQASDLKEKLSRKLSS